MNNSAGLHIIMDAKVKDAVVFEKENVIKMFETLVAALDMKALDEVKVYEVPVDPEILKKVQETGVFMDDGGISIIQVISTSHISIHAWPLQNFFSLDAFSCKNFDADKALTIVRDFLQVKSESTLIVSRRKPCDDSDATDVRYVDM